MIGKINLHLGTALLASVLIGIVVFLFHLPFAQNTFFFDDSADYIRASQAPFLPTWLNQNSASPIELMHLRQKASGFRAHPWDYLYIENDNAALRHFHGPLSFYAMHIVRTFTKSDRAERLLVSLVTALTSALIVVFLLRLGVSALLAILLALLAGIQSRYIETSIDPTPHSWYMLFALCFLFFTASYLLNRKNSDLYLAAISFSLAFTTLEFSVELVACVPLALALIAWTDKRLLPSWTITRGPLMKAFALFLLTTFLLWPGGWIRGGYFESYGVLSATVLFKNKSAFGGKLTATTLYQALFAEHSALLLATTLCIIAGAFLLVSKRLSVASIVFASYSLIAFVLGLADHFRLTTYVSEFLLFFIATMGLIASDVLRLHPLPQRTSRAFVATLSTLLIISCVQEWQQRKQAIAFHQWLAPILLDLPQKVPAGESLLINHGWESLALYLPQYHYEPTAASESNMPRSSERTLRTRYFLLEDPLKPVPPSHILATYKASPGHTENLWEADVMSGN